MKSSRQLMVEIHAFTEAIVEIATLKSHLPIEEQAELIFESEHLFHYVIEQLMIKETSSVPVPSLN
jgi:hypothetical protein